MWEKLKENLLEILWDDSIPLLVMLLGKMLANVLGKLKEMSLETL